MNGQTYQPGDDVPSAVVKGTRRLSALLSRRLLVPNLDPHRRRNRKTTTGPTDVSAVARRDI